MTEKKLKAYVVYSIEYGPQEGALLVFAHSVKEARATGWRQGGNVLTDDYLDFGAASLKGCDWLYAETSQEKIDQDFPHLVWDMKSCSECEEWGHSPIGDDGLCDECRDNAAEQRRHPLTLPADGAYSCACGDAFPETPYCLVCNERTFTPRR